MEKRNKVLTVVSVCLGIALVIALVFLLEKPANTPLASLPKPEVSEGARGELGIDKNVNEANIDKYLGRTDSVYRDMRMLVDEADYEAIDGDSYLSGFVKGFEVVPLPYFSLTSPTPSDPGMSLFACY